VEYAIDPELLPLINVMPEIDLADVDLARDLITTVMAQVPRFEPRAPVATREIMVSGPEGAPQVPGRVYARGDSYRTRAGLLYIHGGGFCIGRADMCDNDCIRLVDDLDVVVVSVDYRLAPEDPFPAGVEDCYAALVWAAAHCDELGIDPRRLGVGGESAGGGLSAAVALMARDRDGPQLCFQWLGVPEIDDRLRTPSMMAFARMKMFDSHKAKQSWTHYLGDKRDTVDVSYYAAPARASDLSGLPPAFVVTCEFDPLRDEGLDYAVRLIQAGVPTDVRHYSGTFHGSHMIKSAVSDRMIADQTNALRRGLHID